MYKFYIFLAVLSTCNYGFSFFVMREPSIKEMEAKIDEVMANCRKKLRVSLAGPRSYLPVSSAQDEFKCHLACFGEELDFVTDDNKIKWESVRMVVSAFFDKKSKKLEAIKTVQKCEETVVEEEDRCENMYLLFKCLKPEVRKEPVPLTERTERVIADCSAKYNLTNTQPDICQADLTSDKCFYKCIAQGMASEKANGFFWDPLLNLLEVHYTESILLVYQLLAIKRCNVEDEEYENGSCDNVYKYTKCAIDTYTKYIATLKQAVKAMND